MEPFLLPSVPVPERHAARLRALWEARALADPAADPARIALEEFALDLTAEYGPFTLPHPVGKASGQLSLSAKQVRADAEAGLAFAVLKTVIAEDASGSASMDAWRIREPRMVVERIAGRRVAREGWTVSWAGRGWEGDLASYLSFLDEALAVFRETGMPSIPSCKYHLASDAGEAFLAEEYAHTTRAMADRWRAGAPAGPPFTLEQDFSPTLAGTDRARFRDPILRWLDETPALVRRAEPAMRLGVKLMNAVLEDEFQLEMMEVASREGGAADFLVCFNRLFDPERPFGEKKGIAYGGPDLSDRNLKTLREAVAGGRLARRLPISATGDVDSGRTIAEYALRGATSVQLHTFFQLPVARFGLAGVSRSRAALAELLMHPEDGLIASMCRVREARAPGDDSRLRFLDLPAIGREWIVSDRPDGGRSGGA